MRRSLRAGHDFHGLTRGAIDHTTVIKRSTQRNLGLSRHVPGAAVNVRKFVVRATHLDDLVQLGTLTTQCARLLEAAVSSGLNVLVSGGTQVGNATQPGYTQP